MRYLAVMAFVVACWSRLASAQAIQAPLVEENPEYPLAITDRPILLYAGMTQLDLGEDMSSYLKTTTDAMGSTSTTRALFADRTLGLSVAHSFGAFQLEASLARLAVAAISFNTGAIPAVFDLSVAFSPPQANHSYNNTQSANLRHKVSVVPGRLALFGAAGMSVSELSVADAAGVLTPGHYVGVGVTTTVELQLASRLGLYVSANVGGPVSYSSNLNPRWGLAASAELLFALRRWDFYAGLGVNAVTNARLPDLGFGFIKRWGL